ncbi:MAG: GTP cyclohydrolase I [Anaplasma sp.]
MSEDGVDKPSDEDAEEAVRVLVRWIGDSPEREELLCTPRRVLDSYRKIFRGYGSGSEDFRSAVFPNDGYSDMIVLKGARVSSSCEHHMVPILGTINVAYIPGAAMLGIGAIVKVVGVFAGRLQLQERLTVQVAHFLQDLLNPVGVAVLMEAKHWCVMCQDGAAVNDLKLQTSCMLGAFRDDHNMRSEFLYRVRM